MALTKITSGVIHDEFSGTHNLSATTSPQTVDWNASQIFRITPNAAITLNFTDFKIGKVQSNCSVRCNSKYLRCIPNI